MSQQPYLKESEYINMEQGKCPNCNSINLMYETVVIDGDSLYYPFDCDDCGKTGKEWYTSTYIESE